MFISYQLCTWNTESDGQVKSSCLCSFNVARQREPRETLATHGPRRSLKLKVRVCKNSYTIHRNLIFWRQHWDDLRWPACSQQVIIINLQSVWHEQALCAQSVRWDAAEWHSARSLGLGSTWAHSTRSINQRISIADANAFFTWQSQFIYGLEPWVNSLGWAGHPHLDMNW